MVWILRCKRLDGKQGLPDKAGLAQRFKDGFALVEARQRIQPAQGTELAGGENGHVAGHEFAERIGILGDQLSGGVEPFLFVVTEIETRGDGINGIGNNGVAGRQRFPSDGVIHECRCAGRHAVGHDELVRRVKHLRDGDKTAR